MSERHRYGLNRYGHQPVVVYDTSRRYRHGYRTYALYNNSRYHDLVRKPDGSQLRRTKGSHSRDGDSTACSTHSNEPGNVLSECCCHAFNRYRQQPVMVYDTNRRYRYANRTHTLYNYNRYDHLVCEPDDWL